MNLRKNLTGKDSFFSGSSMHSGRVIALFFCASMLVHILAFAGFVVFSTLKHVKPLPSVIKVDLVSFTPEPVLADSAKNEKPAAKSGAPASLKPKSVKPKPRKIPVIKPDISLKAKPVNLKKLMAKQLKKSRKKKPVKPKVQKHQVKEQKKPGKNIQHTVEKTENQDEKRIAQALKRLQEKVAGQGGRKGTGKDASASGQKGYKPIDLYKMVMGSAIKQNWVYNDILAGMNQNLEVRILIKILRNGEIRDIIYETRSGNRYLDESAKRAIKKANPLPPLPAGMYSYDVLIAFTPKGLK